MKYLTLILAIVLLNSCGHEAIEAETTIQNGIELDLLFEKDGCKVYRFHDYGRAIYWSDCRGRTEYSYSTRSGKTNHIHKMQTISD